MNSTVGLFNEYGSTQNRDSTWQPFHGVHKPPKPSELTLSALVASGAHLGHNASLMNPHFIPYAYGTRAGVTVIDLDSTLPLLRRAAALVRAVAARDGTVLFIGTRPDLKSVVKHAAKRMGPLGFHLNDKWAGGTLTNALVRFGPHHVANTRIKPDLAVILNPLQNMTTIRECTQEQVPTIGLIDSNVDPRVVMYPIPANDESTRTAEIVAGVLSIAGREGLNIGRAHRGEGPWVDPDHE
jgi:small subunit ribosomal protein S2